MTQFHVALYGRGASGAREPQSHRPVDHDGDPATKTAAIAMRAAGHQPSPSIKRRGGVAVHYAFALASGAAYGTVLEHRGGTDRSRGLVFGTLLWIGADEVALPLSGLARGPQAYRWTVHAEMLAAHLVFGVAAHIGAGLVRRRL